MTDVKIESFTTQRDYRYLWLKYVKAVDLSVHCAHCLKGEYDRRFRGHLKVASDMVLGDSMLYYLCGVASDHRWEHNLHVAFARAVGQVMEVDDEFCRMRVLNARRLDISPEYIDRSLPQALRSEFATCRNWQFANMVARGLYPSYRARAHKWDKERELWEERDQTLDGRK